MQDQKRKFISSNLYSPHDDLLEESGVLTAIPNDQYAGLISSYSEGVICESSVVSGSIVAIERDFIIVDVGGKSEIKIDISEFKEDEDSPVSVEVDQVIKVYVEKLESQSKGSGKTSVVYGIGSHKKAMLRERWEELKKAHESGAIVKGKLLGRVKGGVYVDLDGIPAFLPGSQVDIKHVKDPSYLFGTIQDCKIITMKKAYGNIVVSRKAVLSVGHEQKIDKFISSISVGDILEGTVKNITNYGTFVTFSDEEGDPIIDGLLHITDTYWTRISHPSENPAIRPRARLKVMVTGVDLVSKKLSLGRKQLIKSPWVKARKRFPEGSIVTGRVSTIEPYGLFVKLRYEPKDGEDDDSDNDGDMLLEEEMADRSIEVEGLVHVSELSWQDSRIKTKRADILRSYKKDQEVRVMVLGYEEGDQPNHMRMSLSITKIDEQNPWQDFANKNPIGSEAKVRLIGVKGNVATFDVVGAEISVRVPLSHFADQYIKGNRVSLDSDRDVAINVLSINVSLQKIYATMRGVAICEDIVDELHNIKAGDRIASATVIEVDNNLVSVEFGENRIPACILLPQNSKPGLLGYFIADVKNNLIVDEVNREFGVVILTEDKNAKSDDEGDDN